MVNKEKNDTTDIAAGADLVPPVEGAAAPVTPVKGGEEKEEEKEEEEKQDGEDEGEKDSAEKKAEGDATSSPDADAAAAAEADSDAKAKIERLRIFTQQQEQIKQAAFAEFQRNKQMLIDQRAELVRQAELPKNELEEL